MPRIMEHRTSPHLLAGLVEHEIYYVDVVHLGHLDLETSEHGLGFGWLAVALYVVLELRCWHQR